MGKKAISIVVLITALVIGVAMPAGAGGVEKESGWRFEFVPYAWLTSINADTTVGNVTSEVDASFSDLWDNFDVVALAGRFEAWKGKWGLIVDGFFSKIDKDQSVETKIPVAVDVKPEVRLNTIDFAVSYEAYRTCPPGKGGYPQISLQPYLGVRYTYLKQELELQSSGPLGDRGRVLGGDQTWWDPYIGARLVVLLSQAWRLGLRADAGGFGIGDAADLTWKLALGVDWRFVSWASLRLGYQWYYTDFDNGEQGSDAFAFDGSLHGPWLGLAFYF